MAGNTQHNQGAQPNKRPSTGKGKPVPGRPLPKPRLPGQGAAAPSVRNPLGAPQQKPAPRKPAPGAKRPSGPAKSKRASGSVAKESKQPSAPAQNARRTSNTGQKPTRSTGPGAVAAPKPKARKEPTTIEELIPVLIRHSVKHEDGLNISQFDEKFLPRVHALVPDSLKRMEDEVVQEYLVDIAHALYVAVVVGQFSSRPVLCGVRAAELAADLVERILNAIQGNEDKRITAIRCANLLVGLTLYSVRLLESASLVSQSINGYTDRYERAVITTYGLKTQAEATGQAPWVGQKNNPLDKRIGRAINTMSNVFGDYIGKHGETLDDKQYDEVLAEFDGFMDRFSPYIEGGRTTAEERRKKLARGSTNFQGKSSQKVEPLEIDELRTRPAGIEIKLTDGRILFVSTDDARRIGAATESEVDDTAKRERAAIEARRAEQEDDVALQEIEEQMKAAKANRKGG